MANYDNIEFLVFRLKNSMIDLYMTDLGFIIDGAYYYGRGLRFNGPDSLELVVEQCIHWARHR